MRGPSFVLCCPSDLVRRAASSHSPDPKRRAMPCKQAGFGLTPYHPALSILIPPVGMSRPSEADPMTDSNEQLIARLRRIEGQVRGIARMLDGDRTCEDVVTQLMAVRASIDTVGAVVL